LSIKDLGDCAGEMNERKRVAVFHKDDCWVRKKIEFIEFDIFLLYDKLGKIATVLIKRGSFNLCEGGARCIATVIG
jgi:hypothetical protein